MIIWKGIDTDDKVIKPYPVTYCDCCGQECEITNESGRYISYETIDDKDICCECLVRNFAENL